MTIGTWGRAPEGVRAGPGMDPCHRNRTGPHFELQRTSLAGGYG